MAGRESAEHEDRVIRMISNVVNSNFMPISSACESIPLQINNESVSYREVIR
jgi:hypothetical protein